MKTEEELMLEFKRKELEDKDAKRDAVRKMAWFSLSGLLIYPFAIVGSSYMELSQAAELLADIAPTYFGSVAVLVSAFFTTEALKK